MNFDDIVPILVLLVYVVFVFLKRRKLKANAAKKGSEKKTAPAGIKRKSASGSRAYQPKIFSQLGTSLKNFFSEIEQQFRMEVEKARIKNLEPAQFHGMGQGRTRISDPYEKEVGPLPGVLPQNKPCAKKEEACQRMEKRMEKRRSLKKGIDVDTCLSRKDIRTAVVWAEILGPPLALRNEKSEDVYRPSLHCDR